MADVLTEKQQHFVAAFIVSGCAAKAYRIAYDAELMSDGAIRVEASRLLANPNITLTVKAERERHSTRHDITVDQLTSMATAAYHLAMSEQVQSPGAAIAAVLAIARLHGVILDKARHEHVGIDGVPVVPIINVTISRKPPC